MTLGLEGQRVGTFFKSLANPTLLAADPTDNLTRLADTCNQSAALNANLRLFGDRLVLAPSAQFQTTLDTDNSIRLNNTILGVSTSLVLIPNRLTGGLQISMTRSLQTEPPRVFRRPFSLSQATLADSSCWR